VKRLVLLTQQAFAEAVAQPLRDAAPDAMIDIVVTQADLDAALQRTPSARLISFGSGIIVPAEILARLSGPAYNLHPGPPDYPGIFPSVFALYDRAETFGVTLHEMAALVDSGPIVAVETFEVPATWDRLALDTAAFKALVALVAKTANQLADVSKPLPRLQLAWRGTRRTRRDFEALCQLPEDVTDEEFARRYRAIGEGPEHAITVTRFGRRFALQSLHEGAVVRGGQPV